MVVKRVVVVAIERVVVAIERVVVVRVKAGGGHTARHLSNYYNYLFYQSGGVH